MRSLLLVLACTTFTLSGCKIIKTLDPEAKKAEAAGQTDEARMAVYAQENWESGVLPAIQTHLVPLSDLRGLLAQGLDVAGEAHGLRPEGEANPYNFAVSGSGTVIEANTESRAAKMKVDTDADGQADVIVQLGPIIRGTALRDAMPFIVFTNFRDQIEFAKLAGALNKLAHEGNSWPEGDLAGKTVSFEGVFTLRAVTDVPEIVPTMLQVGQ